MEPKLLEYQNPYWKNNPENFLELVKLVQEYKKSYRRKLDACGRKRENLIPKYQHLKEWIDSSLPLLKDRFYNTKTKVFWILTGLVDFPTCLHCGKKDGYVRRNVRLSSKEQINGYRLYCGVKCLNKSSIHSKHISERYQKNLRDIPGFKDRVTKKSRTTRFLKYGKFLPDSAIEKQKRTIERHIKENPNFRYEAYRKSQLTRVLHGYSPTWNNSSEAIRTRYEKNGGTWETEETLARRRKTSLKLYGFDDPNQSPVVKQRKRETYFRRFGVDCYWKSDESKTHMRKINEVRKKKEHETKKRNHSFHTSNPEKEAFHLLHFIFPHLQEQYYSEAYPFSADFYDPSQPNTRFEFQGTWTHGKHPFDENDLKDLEVVAKWLSRGTKFYWNAVVNWVWRDWKKREAAKKSRITLIEFWSIEEVREFVIHYFDFLESK